MVRLRTVSPTDPGWTRRRAGKGFVYLDQLGVRLPPEDRERCVRLVIPPAWEEVWICRAPERSPAGGRHRRRRATAVPLPPRVAPQAGRVQARPGAGGRRSPAPGAPPGGGPPPARRDAVRARPGHRVPAAGSRLLPDRRRDLRRGQPLLRSGHDPQGARHPGEPHDVVFDFVAKSGQERYVALADDLVRASVADLLRRRSGGPELLAYKDGRRWKDVTSTDINAYVKEQVGGEVSAKDFRTWHGTVIAAVALAGANADATTPTARKRAVSAAMKQVSEYLGNTPTVARSSYVDPRVIDLFADGVTISPRLASPGRRPVRRQHPRQGRAGGAQPAEDLSRRRTIPASARLVDDLRGAQPVAGRHQVAPPLRGQIARTAQARLPRPGAAPGDSAAAAPAPGSTARWPDRSAR